MRQFVDRYGKYLLLAGLLACGSLLRAQTGHSVRIVTEPVGLEITVDGKVFSGAVNVTWPVGSKHTLSATATQYNSTGNTRYTFVSWTIGGVAINPASNTVTVTADSATSSIVAMFSVEYRLSVRFFGCSDPCTWSPATVYVGGVPYISDTNVWVAAGSGVTLQAVPNTGFVFLGWQTGSGVALSPTFNLSVTMNESKTITARFNVTRTVRLDTSPSGFKLLADRAQVTTPASLEWGWDTDHALGAVSPQQDSIGRWWVFSAWSDGGALHHSYHVDQMSSSTSVTATFIKAVATEILTSPRGLKVKVDGDDKWNQTVFYWGVNEIHSVEAPARLTDSSGRVYVFKGWSNGGAAAQRLVIPEELHTEGLRLVANYSRLSQVTASATQSGAVITVDGAECGKPCVIDRAAGTTVTLAVPASIPLGESSRADFAGWSDGVATPTRTVTAPDDTVSLTAKYALMNRLMVLCEPAAGATMTAAPASGDGYYESTAQVTVSAAARAGYRLQKWEGDLSGSAPSGVVSMSAPRAVRAVFESVPYISPTGVRNAAAEIPAAGVAPGSVVAIFGANMAPELTTGTDNPLAQTLAGVTVRLGDRILPLFFVSPEQINVQFPTSVEPGNQTLTVRWTGHPDTLAQAKIVRNAPGLFESVSDGVTMAVAVHENGQSVTAAAPARRGERITVYGTGFGPCDRPRPDGFAVPYTPAFLLADPVEVAFGGMTVQPESAFAAPGRVGIDGVTFTVPAEAPSGGSVELKMRVNGVESNTVCLPVE